ncbi:MAG: hypothetical protein ABIS36_22795 [Chryseolinea sp.]
MKTVNPIRFASKTSWLVYVRAEGEFADIMETSKSYKTKSIRNIHQLNDGSAAGMIPRSSA